MKTVKPRYHTIEMYVSAATSDIQNLFSNAHSNPEYLCQVSLH